MKNIKKILLTLLVLAVPFTAGATTLFPSGGGTGVGGAAPWPINVLMTSGTTSAGSFQATSSRPLYVGSLNATSSTLFNVFMGKVGIATSAPADFLDVYGPQMDIGTPAAGGIIGFRRSDGQIAATISVNAGDSLFSINSAGGGSSVQINSGNSGASYVVLQANNTKNVGISTTTPYAKLSIQSSSNDQTPLLAIASSTNGLATSTALYIAPNGFVGINTSAPTASLSIGSTGTGLNIYNTVDQTTNYERIAALWTSNVAEIALQTGGTAAGNARVMRWANFGSGGGSNIFDTASWAQSNNFKFTTSNSLGTNGYFLGVSPSQSTIASGNIAMVAIQPTYNQTGSAGGTDLLINRTETATGTGAQLLIDAQVGGTSKFSVSDTGNVGLSSTTPSMTLSVQGNTLISGNLFVANMTATGTASTTNFLATNATSTNSFATTASSTNLFTQNLQAQIKSYPSFTYATSTAWTGTTTIPIGTAYVGELWNGIQCFTDVGSLNIDIYHTSTHMALLNASTTVGTFTWSTNNSLVSAEKRFVDIGTPASSPTKITCTVSRSTLSN